MLGMKAMVVGIMCVYENDTMNAQLTVRSSRKQPYTMQPPSLILHPLHHHNLPLQVLPPLLRF